MAAVAILTFAFLICKVNSQILGPGPTFSVPQGLEPTKPCNGEIYRPSVPVGSLQALPNIVTLSQPISNTITLSQPCLNKPAPQFLSFPAPSCVQNQVPLVNQPVLNPVPPQPTCLPYAPIGLNTPQATPSVITNPAPNAPVVTVVDNTLANSLANALQLLIFSNLLENSGTGNAQNLPCINNYEIVTPDFNVPAIPCDYFSNMVYPEPCVSIPEPVIIRPELEYCCPDPVVSCPEPVVFQSYPTSCGGSYSVIDNSGFQCGPTQVFLETPNQYVMPSCAPIAQIPANVPPMALEVPFPDSIPAQLTCNFGLSPSNQPCVSFNVDPLPCNNVFGSFGNFV